MDVSIVVPLYNEEENIRLLHRAITEAIVATLPDYEIIFVDDGSRDDTFDIAGGSSPLFLPIVVITFCVVGTKP